jgi:hypothetical protein
LIDPSVPRFPAQPISWSEVARLCRRICLLRECNQAAAAEDLRRGPLAEALGAIRTTADSDEAIQQKLDAIFAAEAERVANAAVLAELLAPLIGQKTQSHDPFGSVAAGVALEAAAPPAIAPPPAPAPAPQRRDPADIAHFIDEMIAQDRPPSRPPPARRAS